METLITYGIGGVICLFFLMGYLKSLKKKEARAREAAEKGKMFSEGPKAQHPHIDNNDCIGCGTCTSVCPEGDVLAMIGGKAVIVNGHKCIGHGLCADACPVGAITMVMASARMAADMPYLTIERDEIGGTVAKYPRQKLVMTSPVEFPMYGKFKKLQLSKENLLAFWNMILNRADFNVSTGEKVEDVKRGEDGIFTVATATNQYRSRAVILALGKAGEPRKLGVKGEELPKVMYRLIEADHYINKKILVVGGGDSAVEAAMGLACQTGNQVTVSYRSERFSRIKERNAKRMEDFIGSGKLKVLFNSSPVEFKAESVVLEANGSKQEIPNDFVWIFAGGTPPNGFLKKIGVGFGARDLTLEARKEAKNAAAERKQLAQAAAAPSR